MLTLKRITLPQNNALQKKTGIKVNLPGTKRRTKC